MTEQAVAVIVVNWNGGPLLSRCTASVRATSPTVPIVVVDNGSTDDSVDEAIAQDPEVTVVRLPENLGFAGGANAGIAATTTPFVALLNNDAIARPGWITGLLEPFIEPSGARVAATTGRVLLEGVYVPVPPQERDRLALVDEHGHRWARAESGSPGELLVNSTGNVLTRSGNGRDRDWLVPDGRATTATDVFGFNGGSCMLRRSALDDVGLLDPTFFMYYEDTELSWRLRRRGWQVRHAPTALTVHQHAASSGTRTRFFLLHNARNRLDVAVVHAPWGVVFRAYAHTFVRCVRGPDRAVALEAALSSLRALPRNLSRRLAVDRTATVARRDVARYLTPD